MGTYGILLPCDGSEPMPISVGDYKDIQERIGGVFDVVRFDYDDDVKRVLEAPDSASSFVAVGYVHDEGLLLNLKLNTMASVMFNRELRGPVVVVSGTNDDGEYDGDNHDIPEWFLDRVFDGSLRDVARLLESEAMAKASAMTLAYNDGVFTEDQFDLIMMMMASDDPRYLDRIEQAVEVALTYAAGRATGAISKFNREDYDKFVAEELTLSDDDIDRLLGGEN